MSSAATSEINAHQCVLTLKAPRRTKNSRSGRIPASAVKNTFAPIAVVDGVKLVLTKENMATPATVRAGDPSQILGLNSYLGEIFRKNSGETTE